jgi:hypothetical protein
MTAAVTPYDMSTLPTRLRRVAAEVERLNMALVMSDAISDDLKVEMLTSTQAAARRLSKGPLVGSEEA